MSVADKLPYWIMLEEDILRKMVKGTENKPVVLQVLPELEMGGVEIGTVEIAGGKRADIPVICNRFWSCIFS